MQNVSELKPVDLNEVANSAMKCNANMVYLHWTAGHYGQVYSDYHISIDYDGRIYYPDNCDDFNQYRTHTWHRNTNAIGIALLGCYDATTGGNGWDCDLGSEPITTAQIEACSAVIATICKYGDIDVNDCLTHCECAEIDGYGPSTTCERWDLWFLPDYDGVMRPGGAVLRGKARWYLQHM